MQTRNALAVLAAVGLAACATQWGAPMASFPQASLPNAVKVPAGHSVAMESVGAGDIAYECRAKNGRQWRHSTATGQGQPGAAWRRHRLAPHPIWARNKV